MRSFLLETSIIIDYLKGKENITTVINLLEGDLTSSYICLAELYEGINRVNNRKIHENAVQKFFASLTEIYGLDAEIAQKFGELRAQLKQKGTIIEDLDLFIAATCLVNDIELITLNQRHFSRIEGLKIYPNI